MTAAPVQEIQGASSAVRALATELGEDATRISIREEQWRRFAKDGLVVRLSIGRWRGRSQLTLADLGIEPEDDAQAQVYNRVLNPGSRYILPRDVMKEAEGIESRARYALEKRSYATFWGRWIHADKYVDFREVIEQIRDEYLALRDRIRDNWDELVERARQDYVLLGLQAYNDLTLKGAPGVADRGIDEWVADYVGRCMAQLRDVDFVYRSFYFTWQSEYVATAAETAADQAAAQSIRLSAAERLILEDVRRTESEKAAQGFKQLASDLIADIRTQVYDVVVDALEQIESKDGRLPRNSSRGLKNLIATCSEMVFWSDPELDARIQALEGLLAERSDRRDDDEVRRALVDLGAEARLSLIELDRTPRRSASKVGISDDLGELSAVVGRRGKPWAPADDLPLAEISGGARRRGGLDLDDIAI